MGSGLPEPMTTARKQFPISNLPRDAMRVELVPRPQSYYAARGNESSADAGDCGSHHPTPPINAMNQPSSAPDAPSEFTRRSFLRSTAALTAFAAVGGPAQSLLSEVAAAGAPASTSESLVKLLFESLKPEQK